ncbi:MAG: hypothetical protein AB7K73_08415 [Gammaproteobacteria bacterium]
MGDDTLTMADVSATMVASDGVTAASGSVTTLAAGQTFGGTSASATANTYATTSGGTVSVSTTHTSSTITQTTTASAAVATSTSTVAAADVDPSNVTSYDAADGASVPTDYSFDTGSFIPSSDIDLYLDGNVATVDFNVLAIGDDSLVLVDAFAFTIDDQLSLSSIYVDLAVS